jgi:uncharacterized protein (TIGR03083 family)
VAALSSTRDAYLDQWSVTREWVGSLAPAEFAARSTLTDWSVGDLIAHLGLVADSLSAAGRSPTSKPALSLPEYVATYAFGAAGISARTRQLGAEDPIKVLAELDRSDVVAREVLADPALVAGTVVQARRGPIRWTDFVTTRCIELSVHTDDLARSVPDREGPTLSAGCLAVTSRALTKVLAARAPGRSVEVRVPPYAAVQAVPGPSHTRGTPAAVVEMSPVTLLRLATGRMQWQAAVDAGLVRASGVRGDLAPWLPLLA